MIDGYNRDINYLRVSITDRCNLRCGYCMPKEGLSALGHEDILKYEEILRIVYIAVKMGVAKVRITGGEPLVRRGVVDFISRLSAISGLTDISLTTNGVLLESFAASLFQAGIKRINISLDSLNAEKYSLITRGGELKAVLRGINAVHQVGFHPIKINTVVINGVNDDEILDFALLSVEKPFQIRFIELMPMGRAGDQYEGKYLSNDIIRERIGKMFPLKSLPGKGNNTDGPARIYRIGGALGTIGFISPISNHFCKACNRLRLTADGHLRACLLLDGEISLREALRRDSSDEELQDLIKSAIARKPMQHDISRDASHLRKCAKEMSSLGG
ncbi:MAG: GTP 3',8-cyclase MoaA [Syntrophales bacterium]|nr:GTP 3',8-cyclase MoaA [Syntrophales bacterium]